ncbi:hypothetical protein Y1Q_0016943 [Alligator mississippiensis]|uniref:Uncharacterized protein n=1 Tax=Alligator mississippiensis TaxID=8496 RepID=A0A151NVS5_ALLMI|nr:hypothetical protein Y1Q_0016943 [Alligator mississippiensis]
MSENLRQRPTLARSTQNKEAAMSGKQPGQAEITGKNSAAWCNIQNLLSSVGLLLNSPVSPYITEDDSQGCTPAVPASHREHGLGPGPLSSPPWTWTLSLEDWMLGLHGAGQKIST